MNKTVKNTRLELLVIAAIFIAFCFWAISRCNAKRDQMRKQMEAEAMEDRIQDSLDRAAAMAQALPPKDTTPAAPPKPQVEIIREQVTPLYVVLDELNMRAQPKLNSKLLSRLQLYDELVFLNEVTDFRQEINIGGQVFNEPWVKVKNQRGQVGWVYGAGVHYFKFRRPLDL